MQWRKLGLIFHADGAWGWNKKYTGIPTAEYLPATRRIRVYYYSMDEKQDGRISFIEVDSADPTKIVYRHESPILDIGEQGSFDDSGVCPSCTVDAGGRKFLYYLGVQRTEKAHLYFAGLAISSDGGLSFQKHSRVPILDRTEDEPFIRSACSVRFDPRHGKFRMWYVSARGWTEAYGKSYPSYIIRHATSSDGIQWETSPVAAVDLHGTNEFGLGRPWVIIENGTYRMWYSIRSRTEPYRIGYAESKDGTTWDRKDDLVGIEKSKAGWDSEMICYPSLVDAEGKRFMFHNGNSHGASGLGVAVLEKDSK